MEAFLDAVNATYAHLEANLERLQHAYELAAEELFHQNLVLQAHKQILEQVAQGASLEAIGELCCQLTQMRFPQSLCTLVICTQGEVQQYPSCLQRHCQQLSPTQSGQARRTVTIKPIIGYDLPRHINSFHCRRSSEYLCRRFAQETAHQTGMSHCCYMPFHYRGGKGSLFIFYPEGESDEEYQQWLSQVGSVVVIAVERHHFEQERQQLIEQLQDALKKAQAASEAKSRFLATMSREIRTPMNGILGMGRLLLQTPLTDEQCDYLRTLQSSAEHLLALLNDILDLAKLESGQMSLDCARLELPALVQDVVRLFRAKAVQQGLSLETHIDPRVPSWVRGDPVRLRQILANLIGNALKFTHTGGVTIRVQPVHPPDGESAHAASESLLHFAVQDTGIGIPPDKLDTIFEPFVQADSTTTRQYGGTGLGLAICKQLVEMMGGRIGVQSEPGKGSTFWFEVPLEPVEAIPERDTAAPAAELPPLPPLRVLLVEDNAINCKVAARMLEQLGCQVEIATNGREAVEKTAEQTYDLVLMDCQMPEMDGYEATRRIREREQGTGRHQLIIALTAHASASDREQCLACGMDDYLEKPILRERLEATLRTWFIPSPESELPKAS